MEGKTILITGGTGSLGKALTKTLFDKFIPKKVIVFSRDEFKQSEMRRTHEHENLRYFIGDVRDKDRLKRAMSNVDVVIHAAALKQVPALEYNPTEAVKTNIYGTQNVIDACLDCGVEKAIFISTDKAVNPINLYGATKMAAEKLWNAANVYSRTVFSSVRYGNVVGSRGSVIPLFRSIKDDVIPVTDPNMTRFWITLDQAVELVMFAYNCSDTGTFVPKLKATSMKSLAMCFNDSIKIIGVRPGEKTHELMIAEDDSALLVDLESKTAQCTSGPYRSDTCEQLSQFELSKLTGTRGKDAYGPNC
jgi:UDP-N-acetylglucosamine 4,6-dehydratase/5-epimerase